MSKRRFTYMPEDPTAPRQHIPRKMALWMMENRAAIIVGVGAILQIDESAAVVDKVSAPPGTPYAVAMWRGEGEQHVLWGLYPSAQVALSAAEALVASNGNGLRVYGLARPLEGTPAGDVPLPLGDGAASEELPEPPSDTAEAEEPEPAPEPSALEREDDDCEAAQAEQAPEPSGDPGQLPEPLPEGTPATCDMCGEDVPARLPRAGEFWRCTCGLLVVGADGRQVASNAELERETATTPPPELEPTVPAEEREWCFAGHMPEEDAEPETVPASPSAMTCAHCKRTYTWDEIPYSGTYCSTACFKKGSKAPTIVDAHVVRTDDPKPASAKPKPTLTIPGPRTPVQIGADIRAARVAQGMAMDALAEMALITASDLHAVEAGHGKACTVDVWSDLAQGLGLDLGALLGTEASAGEVEARA